jgi:hypothetical protein
MPNNSALHEPFGDPRAALVRLLSCCRGAASADGIPIRLPHAKRPSTRLQRSASAEPVCSCALSIVHVAHETAGAARIRRSLLPLLEGQR